MAVADVNGDGKPDLVVANYGSNTVSVLLGNGNGTFQTQQTFATGSEPYSVAVASLNGDGKPDLVVANFGDSTVSVLLGNGNGTFQAQQTFATGTYPSCRGGGGCQRRRQARPRRRQLRQQHGERAAGQRQRHLPDPADLRHRQFSRSRWRWPT